MSRWPPSTSNVAPVTAVLVMTWTAIAARIGRRDHPADGQRGAQLLAPVLECGLVAVEERRRQRGVDEAGLDQVDADWRELERERRGERPQQ